MARDYKHRTQQRHYRRKPAPPRGGEWRWLLIVLLVGAFAAFLIYLRVAAKPGEKIPPAKQQLVVKPQQPKAAPQKPKSFEPTFDFYTILPEQEVVVPEPEIKTRAREESIGKSKDAQYVIQAGSFRNPEDADKVKARLAMMGIEAKIETAKNGAATWNRVKIGPLTKMAKVDAIRSRLHAAGIDVVVMQIGR
jgi:cell division protein FtsN